MSRILFIAFIVSIELCLSHIRLMWPTPRSTNAAPSSRPNCGGVTFEQAYANGLITDLNAGDDIKIILYEQIFHSEQPMRLAISSENDEDFETCIWLNHIPQSIVDTQPKNLTIPLTVPDFTCKNCTLQLIAFQNGGNGNDECCSYHNNATKTCQISQYYSCANININGGKRSRSDVCVQPSDWDYRDYPCNHYRGEKNNNAWEMEDDGSLTLRTSGSIDGKLDLDDFCADTADNILKYSVNTDCHKSATDFDSLSLLQGGNMQGDGIFAIILILILAIAITATYIITKKKGIRNDNEPQTSNF